MKRKVIFLLGFIGVSLVLFLLLRFLTNRNAAQGVLKVDSSNEASVFLDNKHIGLTPYEDKTDTGQYTIKIVPESTVDERAPWQGKITISSNRLTYVNVDLADSELATAVDILWLEDIASRDAEVTVVTSPDGASVMLDDASQGITPLTVNEISEGDHTLTITSPGFLTRTLKIKATAGYKLNAAVKLALSAGGAPDDVRPPDQEEEVSTPSVSFVAADGDGEPDTPYVVIADTPTGFLRVREEPTTAATEAAQVRPGEKYTVFDEDDDWYQIEYREGERGWISGRYAEKTE